MKQVINLLNSLPKKRDIILPLSLMVKIYLVFLVVLSGLYLSIFYHVRSLEKSLQTLRTQEKATTVSVITLTKALSTMVEKSQVGQKTASVEKAIKAKESILKKLKTMDLKPTKGFYRIFMGLEKGVVKGAWIDTISIRKEGGILIKGSAVSSKEVLGFVGNLNRQKEFMKYPFKLSSLQQGGASGDGQARFELSSPYQLGDN